MKMTNAPLVSIIITTKNEEANIEKLLQSITQQVYKRYEIIVIDNNSSDKTKEISLQYTNSVYNFGPERSAQRNYGVSKANGTYVLILDADMMLTPRVLQECIELVSKENQIKTVIIPEMSIGNNFWAKCKVFERNFYLLDKGGVTDAARFFEKKIFQEVKGYDTQITGPEDWDLPERINHIYPQKGFINALIIHNEGKLSLIKLMKKKYYYALQANKYLHKHRISVISPKTIYFLRPVFYTNYKLWFKNPLVSLGTLIMLTAELIAGGWGYVKGKLVIR